MRQISRHLLLCVAVTLGYAAMSQANSPPAELQVRIGYLAYVPETGPLLSNVIPEPEDAGRRITGLVAVFQQ